MKSVILQTAARPIVGLTLLVSVVVLLRGHNEPGGGFVGGLLFAAALSLHALAFSTKEAKSLLRVSPKALLAVGVLIASLSSVPPMMVGDDFFKGVWFNLNLPGFENAIKVGTPVLFDIGVYLTVAGVLLVMIFTLEEIRDDAADIN
jgi:multicomponent Na+:H+ antiporter subunit B